MVEMAVFDRKLLVEFHYGIDLFMMMNGKDLSGVKLRVFLPKR